MAGLALVQSLANDGLFSEHYTLGHQFARGAFSAIHSVCSLPSSKHLILQAVSLSNHETVAVKVVPLEEDDEIQEVGREVAFFKEVNHPNLVGYRGSWIESSKVYVRFSLVPR